MFDFKRSLAPRTIFADEGFDQQALCWHKGRFRAEYLKTGRPLVPLVPDPPIDAIEGLLPTVNIADFFARHP